MTSPSPDVLIRRAERRDLQALGRLGASLMRTHYAFDERRFLSPVFPADQETADLISYASTNVWWITLDETSFTYNLRRIGTDRLFTVRFDLTKPISTPSAPWGWEE